MPFYDWLTRDIASSIVISPKMTDFDKGPMSGIVNGEGGAIAIRSSQIH